MDASTALSAIDEARNLAWKERSHWSLIVPGSLYSVAMFSFGGAVLLHGTSWQTPLIVTAVLSALGVVVTAVLFAKRGGISPLPGAGLTMTQRWRLMWLSFAVLAVEVGTALSLGFGWAVMLAGILGWIQPGVSEWVRKK